MRVLLDTNVLLRAVQINHPLFPETTNAISALVRRNDTLFFSPQNIVEFWNVATRPIQHNGFGLPSDAVVNEIAGFERSFSLLPDVPEIYQEWKKIVATYKVQGVRVHDARLIAIMTVYSLSGLLTFDISDFARFSNITAIHPSSFSP